jgi:hypothetical protein
MTVIHMFLQTKVIMGPIYRVIQEELPPLMELISDILSKKCHINLGPIHNIYRVRIWKRATVNCAWRVTCLQTPHFNRTVVEHLNVHFHGRWVGQGSVHPWTPRSPDISPLYYCIWG